MKLRMTRADEDVRADVTDADIASRDRDRARPDAGRRRRRAHLRRRAAVEPERPRVPARARRGSSRPRSGSTTTRSTSRRAATARRPRSRWCRATTCSTCSVRADLAHQRTKVNGQRLRRAQRATDRRGGRRRRHPGRDLGRTHRPGRPAAARSASASPTACARCRCVAARRRAWAQGRDAAARARLRDRRSARPTARPDMVVGSKLTLERVGAPFDGDGYYVTRVSPHATTCTHGHRTHFEAERATIERGADVIDGFGPTATRRATSASTRRSSPTSSTTTASAASR